VADFDEHGNQFSGFTNVENLVTSKLIITETWRVDSSLTISFPKLPDGKKREREEICAG
jgi:hypothetical protein